MKLLLDSHTFLWWASEPAKLSSTALTLCSDPANSLLLSSASAWEVQIKHSLGKLGLTLPLSTLLAQQRANGLGILPVTVDHVLLLDTLPYHHKDPFDRLIIAQAIVEGASVVTADQAFSHYSVSTIW